MEYYGYSLKMELTWQPFTLQLKYPFSLASHTRSTTPIVLIKIIHEGFTGFGEASLPPYLGETQESIIDFLARIDLSGYRLPLDIQKIMQDLDLQPGHTPAKAAIDIALHDLLGKMQEKPCYELFGSDPELMPPTACTIGMDSSEMISKKTREAGAFRILKIKLGGPNDRELIQTVRQHTNVLLSVDANQGWHNREEALKMAQWLAQHGVLFIEQPFGKYDLEDTAWLKERSPIPLIADESVQRFEDIEKAAEAFDGINIKLMKCTGMLEAFKMIRKARSLHLKILMGCMTETSCATMAAAHLAPLCDWADLDGPFLSINNPFEPPVLKEGKIRLSHKPGLGLNIVDGW